jgi:hypothetical protein
MTLPAPLTYPSLVLTQGDDPKVDLPAAARRRLEGHAKILQTGKLNCTGVVVLQAGSATTTLTDPLITYTSTILFMPTTANAAAALAGLYVTDTLSGSGGAAGTATLRHANNAQTDREFRYVVIG